MTDEKGEIYDFRDLGETFVVSSVYNDTKTQGKRVRVGVGTTLFGDLTNSGQSLQKTKCYGCESNPSVSKHLSFIRNCLGFDYNSLVGK